MPGLVRIVVARSYFEAGAGLQTDARFYAAVLRRLGHDVVVQSVAEACLDDRTADANLFLEHMYPAMMRRARRNFFMVNPEIGHRHEPYPRLDAVLCKTRYSTRLLRAFVRGLNPRPAVVYTRHCSEDRYRAAVPRNYARVLHAPGKSLNKGTGAVLAAWTRHPEWPRLDVVVNSAAVPVPDAARMAPNIVVHDGFLAADDVVRIQNECGAHLCPSEAEGWGHYANEARSVGAVLLTTDAPPMNEFVRDGHSGLLIAADPGCQPNRYTSVEGPAVPGACAFPVRVEAIEAAVARYLRLSASECARMGREARRGYERDRAYAERTLAALFAPERLRPATTLSGAAIATRTFTIVMTMVVIGVLLVAVVLGTSGWERRPRRSTS